MAFSSFGNTGAATAGAAPSVQAGPDLGDIQTEGLGFLALSGESKIQLLPSPWPADNLPPPTASLMSVASHKGLVAAAGPNAVIIATTESVRKAFKDPAPRDGNFKSFQPQLTLPMQMRVSQLAFSADELYLVLAAEVGGGLAVYEVQALLQGSTQSAFELSTNGQALRALVPNPTAERAELFAIVTADGNFMMANLKEKAIVPGPSGQILKEGVSCLSWTTKGKQLVAGFGNGTACQMTPDGLSKVDIPKPPGIDDNHHVSSILWIENNVFLVVHTPSNFNSSEAPSSVFHIVTRDPSSGFIFQRISEPAGPFGLNRSPPHNFFLRLKDFPPNLQDVIIVASTASTDIGIFSRSQVPLANDKPAGVFAMTEMSDDSRRAQLPMSASLADTSPIGVALDLSSKEKVLKPIPSDEMDASQTPLPALMVLNNDGVLASWWIVYSDSIRQGTTYPGLVVAEGAQPSAPLAQAAASTFGSPPKPFGAPSIPAPTSKSAFGAPSGLGMRQSPWATSSTAAPTGASTFGTPAFGTPSAPSINKPAFGAPSFGAPSTPAFGSTGFSVPKSSPWGSAATSASTTFGQTTVLGKPGGVFGSAAPVVGAAAPSTGGFASFASKGGFAAAAATPSSGSIFGARPSTGVFGAPSTSSGMGTTSVFGGTKGLEEKAGGPFGSHANNIVIGSTFKADQTAKDERTDASNEPNRPFFGETFGNALGEAAKPPLTENVESKDADMDSTEDISKLEEPVKPSSPTPSSRTAPATSSFFPSAPLDTGGLFGRTSIPPSSAATKSVGSPGFGFGRPAEESKSETFGFSGMNVSSPTPPTAPVEAVVEEKQPSPKVKKEPVTDGEPRPFQRDIDEPPLPPDPTSKTSYAAGDTSVSSTGTEPPLPPDFLPKPATQKPVPANLIPPSYVPGGPDDEEEETEFLSDENDGDESEGPDEEEGEEEEEEGEEEEEEEEEEEGSGEDVAKDLSPASEANETTGFTPQSSFGGLSNRNPESNLFTKIQKPHQLHQPRTLFGELDRAAPVLPPPKLPASPRSPSPVRSALPGRMLRHESSRSVSAPGIASQILGSQRLSQQPAATTQSTFTLSLEQQKAAEKRRAEAKASKEAAEKQALVDNEDEDLQRFLASEPTGTTTLDEFVAHSNYIGPPSMDSIPSQVETVYRDINSMIDTLGLNARTLKCFIKGHTEQRKEGGRTREDLEGDEEWCLVEIEDLSENVESTLMRELESSRVRDVANKLEACSELQRDLIRLRARHEDIKKIHASRLDPSHVATARAQPLSAEQAAQQHDLRRDFLKFQSLLSEAEEGLTVLKAKIVSQATSHGKSSTGTGPTVEAVMRTITKMTSMAEKRSGDIDVLEGQMRKLRFNSAASTGSREGSPFATPQNNRTSLRNPSTSSTYGLFYTPDSIRENQRGFQDSLVSSTGSFTRNSPPRKKLSGYTPEEKNQLRTKLARKKMVTDRLRAALQNAGTNVRLMDDDDEKLWG